MKVLVLPGLDGTGNMLTEFEARLRTRVDVQVLRYPENASLNYSELADFVSMMLPKKEPYSIIAESFSGPVAAIIASKNSDGLRALIFVASFVRKPTSLPKVIGSFARAFLLRSSFLLRLAAPFTFGKWRSKTLNELLRDSVGAVSSDILAFRIRLVMEVDELTTLERVTVPMLYLRPTQDRLISSSAFEVMKAANPALDLMCVEGPHFVLQVQAEECAKYVMDFLEALPHTKVSHSPL